MYFSSFTLPFPLTLAVSEPGVPAPLLCPSLLSLQFLSLRLSQGPSSFTLPFPLLSAVSEPGTQSGFDPSDFPMLGLGRGRQDGAGGGLMASANMLARQGFNSGEFVGEVQITAKVYPRIALRVRVD